MCSLEGSVHAKRVFVRSVVFNLKRRTPEIGPPREPAERRSVSGAVAGHHPPGNLCIDRNDHVVFEAGRRHANPALIARTDGQRGTVNIVEFDLKHQLVFESAKPLNRARSLSGQRALRKTPAPVKLHKFRIRNYMSSSLDFRQKSVKA